jgi:hypothetical protein
LVNLLLIGDYLLYSRRLEAGQNTSTVALRAVEGDEKETGCLGYKWANLSVGGINTGTCFPRLTTFACKEIIVAKSKEMKTGCSLAESSKESCG